MKLPHVTLPQGEKVPALGLGTWHMGEHAGARKDEVAALKLGIELGMTLIDTAEMYGEGGAEQVVAEASAGQRDKLFIVSKVYPHNASRKGVPAACERSLKRLNTERIDLYLLHWRGSHPFAETVEALEKLCDAGKIRHWGVSNLDSDDIRELAGVPNGSACVSNQVMYNLETRGVEWELLDLCREAKIMVMAYSPLGQGPLLRKPALKKVADKHKADPAAVALAWLLLQPDVVVIPKATRLEHVRANATALDVKLDADDLKSLEAAFSPPKRATPLSMT